MLPSRSTEPLASSTTFAVPLALALRSLSGPALAQGSWFSASRPPATTVLAVVFLASETANRRTFGEFGKVRVLAPGGRSRRYLNK